MPSSKENEPLHGITLKHIVEALVEKIGWDELAEMIPVRCFAFDPSLNSSLKFLRQTPWARKKTEQLYLHILEQ